MNKMILLELKKRLRLRGEITKEQREYARVEVQVIKEMYSIKELSEEAGRPYSMYLECFSKN